MHGFIFRLTCALGLVVAFSFYNSKTFKYLHAVGQQSEQGAVVPSTTTHETGTPDGVKKQDAPVVHASEQSAVILPTDTRNDVKDKAAHHSVLYIPPLKPKEEEVVQKVVDTVTHGKLQWLWSKMTSTIQNEAVKRRLFYIWKVIDYLCIYPTKTALCALKILWNCTPDFVKSIMLTSVSMLIVFILYKLGYFNIVFSGTHMVLHALQRVAVWFGLGTLGKDLHTLDGAVKLANGGIMVSAQLGEHVINAAEKIETFLENYPNNPLLNSVIKADVAPSLGSLFTSPLKWAKFWIVDVH